jgi:hypothetical protein
MWYVLGGQKKHFVVLKDPANGGFFSSELGPPPPLPQASMSPTGRGGHRHLQIGRILDIDLISEPPHAPSPQMYVQYTKCANLCGQRGRK